MPQTSPTPGTRYDLGAGDIITAARRRFTALLAAGEVRSAVESTYTVSARMMPPEVPAIVGRDAIVAYWLRTIRVLQLTALELDTVELHPLGDRAYEIGRATVVDTTGERTTGKYVLIWRDEDGAPRIDVDIWNIGS
jgi:ketosteroid isomerase-like protein